jgi:hypothetical protein
MNKFVEGRMWILETLFQIAEESEFRIHDVMFVPTRDGQKLLLRLDGRIACEKFQSPDVLSCAEGTTIKNEVLLHRAKVRKRLRELLNTVPWTGRQLPGEGLSVQTIDTNYPDGRT